MEPKNRRENLADGTYMIHHKDGKIYGPYQKQIRRNAQASLNPSIKKKLSKASEDKGITESMIIQNALSFYFSDLQFAREAIKQFEQIKKK